VHLKFVPTFNGQPLSIDSVYTNSFGQQLRVENIQFYLSNIYAHNGTDSTLLKQAVLFTLLEPQTLSLNVSPQSFSSLSFGIGVPGNLNKNVDPSQYANSNPLSVQGSNGMFWYWNTGYIFVKVEGRYELTGMPNAPLMDSYSYHMGDDPLYRVLNFNTGSVSLAEGDARTFNIEVAVDSVFNRPSDPIDLSIDNLTHTTSNFPLAERITDNFVSAFHLQ
ncbi:MAG: hypothetical protein RI989_1251, partial [Bacteroidota bacterium]